jgi:hypothetical protein
MPTYEFHGVPVDFPFEAYDVQKAYMSKVIEALNARDHALLESPTGTGETPPPGPPSYISLAHSYSLSPTLARNLLRTTVPLTALAVSATSMN